jgi:hypothetical protein
MPSGRAAPRSPPPAARESQPGGETAVQIGPQTRHWDQRPEPRRGRAPVFVEQPQPRHQQDQREQMRPRQVVHACRAGRANVTGNATQAPAPRRSSQANSSAAGRQTSSAPSGHAGQSPPAMNLRENQVRQPFPGVPGLARAREGEQIAAPGLRGREYIPGADVPARVAIAQQRLPGVSRPNRATSSSANNRSGSVGASRSVRSVARDSPEVKLPLP